MLPWLVVKLFVQKSTLAVYLVIGILAVLLPLADLLDVRTRPDEIQKESLLKDLQLAPHCDGLRSTIEALPSGVEHVASVINAIEQIRRNAAQRGCLSE